MLNNKFKREMGNKNITMQDTQKENQVKEVEINGLKQKVLENEEKIVKLEQQLSDVVVAKKMVVQKIKEKEDAILMEEKILQEKLKAESFKKSEPISQDKIDLEKKLEILDKQNAMKFLEARADELEFLCWI